MTAKEHYDRHLGRVYSWMLGDFQERMSEQRDFFSTRGIFPERNRLAFDLGAGNGIQSVALAHLGFKVRAIDFNKQLLDELNSRKENLAITTDEKEVLAYLNGSRENPEVIVCMGDTLSHLQNDDEVRKFVSLSARLLIEGGKLVVSYRDLAEERHGIDRFLLVKADDNRALTCFLEYSPKYVTVHDILTENVSGQWIQKVSSYQKLRIAVNDLKNILMENSFRILHDQVTRGMTYITAQKV